MVSRTQVTEFLAQKKFALLRASGAAKVKGFSIDKELGKKGYTVSVLYLDDAAIDAQLKDLKASVGGAIVAVSPDMAESAVRKVIDAKIPRIWLQHGSDSKAAIALCKKSRVMVIHGVCIMMFAHPVKSVHAFHRWIWRMVGKLPM